MLGRCTPTRGKINQRDLRQNLMEVFREFPTIQCSRSEGNKKQCVRRGKIESPTLWGSLSCLKISTLMLVTMRTNRIFLIEKWHDLNSAFKDSLLNILWGVSKSWVLFIYIVFYMVYLSVIAKRTLRSCRNMQVQTQGPAVSSALWKGRILNGAEPHASNHEYY